MKLTKKEDSLDLGINMTPMIDIVFQLIIFFMVVSELATLDLERLTLPYADQTDTSKIRGPESTQITINVTRETDEKKSVIKIKRVAYTDQKLVEFLRFEAEMAGMVPNEYDPTKNVSLLEVLIRADRDAPFEAVQRVLDSCQKVAVWMTSVSTTEEKFTREE